MIWDLRNLPDSARAAAGGKARTLARLAQAGYPVPPGFIIPPGAFRDGDLRQEAWDEVLEALNALRGEDGGTLLAVRSSAAIEDSASASFAGEFETVLNVVTDEEVRRAIRTVFRSRKTDRVASYSMAQGVGTDAAAMDMAVIVQKQVPAEMAGVLFTADPLSGSLSCMAGNYIHGLGDRLVAGEGNPMTFTLEVPSGEFHGPDDLLPYAGQLFALGRRLAQELGGPQDIEWAISRGELALLQARPVTTMKPYNPATGEWNDTRRGVYLWSNANFGEAIPDVMTPLTWSGIQIYAEETFNNPLPGANPLMGNIGGRFYVNLSLFASFMETLGFDRERMNRESEELFGNLPENIDIPMIPFSRLAVLRRFGPFAVKAVLRRRRNLRHIDEFTGSLPGRIADLDAAVRSSPSSAALAQIWEGEIEPLLRRAYQMLQAGTSRYENAYRPLRRKLVDEVGETDANLLLSGVSEAGDPLASLGPLLGLWQIRAGELRREDYLHRFGHRGPHEFELSWPRPSEDPDWLDAQLASLGEVDVPAKLARRGAEKSAAWERYTSRFPDQAAKMEGRLSAAARAARGREAIRSEVTRLVGLTRRFALRGGELTGLGDDVFFLWLEELLSVLRGEPAPEGEVRVRRRAHERLSALPPYPALIVGRFDPGAWAADPDRRSDVFDARAAFRVTEEGASPGLVRGLPGSAGVAEGAVRILHRVDDGHLLNDGEILVAGTTNVGWTPLFPRAAAVVTDVGAPLSHAAIVARELGIPAVIGAGDATMRLKTGDRVRVDGARGVVEILNGDA